jgi:hypothetical protein
VVLWQFFATGSDLLLVLWRFWATGSVYTNLMFVCGVVGGAAADSLGWWSVLAVVGVEMGWMWWLEVCYWVGLVIFVLFSGVLLTVKFPPLLRQ